MAKIFLTAQNIDIYHGDSFDPYARTGATSVEQIHRAGVSGVILGHSEVGDTPDVVRKKLLTIIQKGDNFDSPFLKNVTLLVGESWKEFQNNSHEAVSDIVSRHLMSILNEVPQNYVENLVVGYEPKWGSFGSGHDNEPPPSPELILLVCKKIRTTLTKLFGGDNTNSIPIIYGGRSTPQRTEEILADNTVDGLILGSACTTIKKMMDIAGVMARVRPTQRKILHANFKAFDLVDSYEEYLRALHTLDDSFIVYFSPCHVDIREIKNIF